MLCVFKRSAAADDGQPHVRLCMQDVDDADQADFSGAPHMRRAAGADVNAVNRHNADRPREFFLAAVCELLQHFLRRIFAGDLHVAVNDFIRTPFEITELRVVQLPAGIERNGIVTQAKAHIFITVQRMEKSRQDVLAGMILHVGKAVRPVDRSGNSRPLPWHRALFCKPHGMNDDAVPDLHVCNGKTGKNTGVGRLPALFGEKQRPVQYNRSGPGLFIHRYFAYSRFKTGLIWVFII